MAKRWLLPLMALVLMLCCGCSMFATPNVNDLLRAPALGGGLAEIQKALEAYLGTEAHYVYPKEGEWKSPLLQEDLDDDGVDEAVLLYTLDDSTAAGRERGNTVYLAVLEQQENGWQVVWDEPGPATDVASFEAADLMGDGSRQLVVGYATANMATKTLALYLYADNTLSKQYQSLYSRYEIGNFSNENGNDVVVVSPDETVGGLTLSYVSARGDRLQLVQEPMRLYANFVSCAGIVPSHGPDGEVAMVVDGISAANTGALASQIIYYSEGRFFAIDDSGRVMGATARLNPLLRTRDIDDDGVAEIPLPLRNGQVQTPAGDKNMEFVTWWNYTAEGEPLEEEYGLVDSNFGIYIRLPSAWRGLLKVVDGENAGEWHLQYRTSGKTLVSLHLLAGRVDMPLGAQPVPGSLTGYLTQSSGLSEEEKATIQMISLR